MADNNQNLSNDDSNPSSGSGTSPWDEQVDLPKEDEGKPKTIGTLEPTEEESVKDSKPVPFNIPEGVGEEKVGKVESADKYIGKNQKVESDKNIPDAKPATVKPLEKSALPNKPIVDPAGQLVEHKPPVSKPLNKPPVEPLKTKEPTPPQKPDITPPPESVPEKEVPVPISEIEPAVPKEADAEPVLPKEPIVPRANLEDNPPDRMLQNSETAEKSTRPEPKKPKKSFWTRFSKKSDPGFRKEIKEAPKKPPRPKEPKPVFTPKPRPIRPRGPVRPPFYKKTGFLVAFVAILFLTLGVYLTEAGIISIGLEKAYGLVGLENLWGGLPKNPEKALVIATLKTHDNLNFKAEGKITMTVDKTVESSVTSPLVLLPAMLMAGRDENIGLHQKAQKTQSDYYGSDYDYYYDQDSTSDDSASNDQESSDPTSGYIDQSTESGYQKEETTIKEIEADFDGYSSDNGASFDLTIKKIVGKSSIISIISSSRYLYVKTSSDIKFDQSAQPDRWLQYSVGKSEQESVVADFFGIQFDRGFSIIGRRVGSDRIDKRRCYKYQIDNLEIGDSLDNFGVTGNMVQKISGDIWIGVADHLIHKVNLTIIPSVSSSVSRIDFEATFSDYGIENSVTVPTLSDKILVGLSEPSVSEASGQSESANASVEARDGERKNDLAEIKSGLEKYKNNNGLYPKSTDWSSIDNSLTSVLVPEYLSALPPDPKSADNWWYGYRSNGSTFTLSARLENTADPQTTKIGDKYLHYVYND